VDEASCLVALGGTAGNLKQPEDRCGSGRQYLGAEARCLSHDGGSLRGPSYRQEASKMEKASRLAGLPASGSLGTTDGYGVTRMRNSDPWHPYDPWWSWAGFSDVDEASCLVVWDYTAGNLKQPEDR